MALLMPLFHNNWIIQAEGNILRAWDTNMDHSSMISISKVVLRYSYLN